MAFFHGTATGLRRTAVAALVLLASAGMAEAKTLKIVTGDGPQHDGTKAMATWAESLPEHSGGDVSGRVFPQTLVAVREIPGALRDGVADLGLIVHPYHPAEFPEANFIADFSLFADNNAAAAGAATEYILTCGECMAEMKKQGTVYLGNIANAPYSLITKSPVRTLADFQNLKVRSGGEAWGRWIEALGGVKVQLPAAEAYQALSQGMLDAHTHSIGSLVDQSLSDVAKHVTDIPVGVYFGASMNFSRRNWEGLTDAQRQAVFDRAPYLLSQYVSNLIVARDAVRSRLDSLGVTLEEPADDLLEANRNFLAADQTTIVDQAKSIYGVDNAAEKAERFLALVAKWKGLAEGMGDDPAALGDLYKAEIFDKITVATISE